jgi:hypothetical protein
MALSHSSNSGKSYHFEFDINQNGLTYENTIEN